MNQLMKFKRMQMAKRTNKKALLEYTNRLNAIMGKSIGETTVMRDDARRAILEKELYTGWRMIRTMRQGEAFGEIALMKPDGRRTLTVLAHDELHLVQLTRDDYKTICSRPLPTLLL